MTELEYFNGDELAASTWRSKYAAEGEQTPDDTHRRMAKEFARIEQKYPNPMSEEEIYELFKNFKYVIPGGSVMAGLGTGDIISLSNCFVIGSPKDSYAEIMKVRNQQIQLMKRRGGVGYDLSKLRPRGAKVHNSAKTSTGAASFMNVDSDISNEVAQDGRRGALMLSISINHPDVEEFITKKQDLTKVTGANVSVKVTDEFMQAVIEDKDYLLRFPIDLNLPPDYHEDSRPDFLSEFNKLYAIQNIEGGGYVKKVRARELWKTLIHCAWNTAEPGIIFEGAMHNYSPDGIYPDFRMIGTNPCGEIPMGPFDSCRLIHLNLTSFVKAPFTELAVIDSEELERISYKAMKLADDLVDLEIEAIDRIIDKVKDEEDQTELELWNTIKNNTMKGRRAGLGFTGLADTLAMLWEVYGSSSSVLYTTRIMKHMFKGQLDAQIDMAIERGAFPAWNSVVEAESNSDWLEFIRSNYSEAYLKMAQHGRRNISWSTVAPTGTVSIMAGTSSGIEPVFMPWYKRRRKVMNPTDRVDYTDIKGEKYTEFIVIHPKFKMWCETYPLIISEDPEGIRTIRRADINKESDLEYLFRESPYKGATAHELNWEKRIEIQKAVQAFITHSISSTINLPSNTTEEEVSNIYLKAWEEGLKGLTVYRDGCREGVLSKIEKPKTIIGKDAPKRPRELEADCYLVKAKGEQFIILVGLLDNKPYEIFTFRPANTINFKTHKGRITKVKKMHYSFDSDILHIDNLELANDNVEENTATLYSSMLLRHGVSIEYIIKTARKVNDNISSFSSAMCRILSKYSGSGEIKGEKCPNCGEGRLVRVDGCIKCIDCGYSKCL